MDRRGHDRMVVGFTTTYAIRARCTTLCDKVCQWLATGRWFSPGPPGPLVSSTKKTYHHDITEILLKVALNTIKHQTNRPFMANTEWNSNQGRVQILWPCKFISSCRCWILLYYFQEISSKDISPFTERKSWP